MSSARTISVLNEFPTIHVILESAFIVFKISDRAVVSLCICNIQSKKWVINLQAFL